MLASLIERNAPPQKPGEEVNCYMPHRSGPHLLLSPSLVTDRMKCRSPINAIWHTDFDRCGRSTDHHCGSSSPAKDRGADARPLGWLLASYLLGAIPTSYIVSRTFAHIDLRQHGSGNLGATNLYRVLGWKYAIPVGLFDIAKGVIPVLGFAARVSHSELFGLACGIAAIVGHVFSVFVGFKGGKGVATAAGRHAGSHTAGVRCCSTVLAPHPPTQRLCLPGQHRCRRSAPLGGVLSRTPDRPQILWLDVLIAIGVIALHRKNIHRLLKGTENRFGRGAASTSPR